MNNDIGLEQRKEILTHALLLEYLTSLYLSLLLGINDFEQSKSFGNQGGSLSFHQKIDLLIDLNILLKDEKKKYQIFMEIRNQFMHNLKADSYEACYNYLSGRESFILKTYPQSENLSKELRLRNASRLLAEELTTKTAGLISKIKEKKIK